MMDWPLCVAAVGFACLILILDIARTHGMTTRAQNNLAGIAGIAVLILAIVALSYAPRPGQQPPQLPPVGVDVDLPDFSGLLTEDYTPPEMLGLPDDHAEVAQEAYTHFPEGFQVSDPATAAENAKKNVRIYEIVRRVSMVGKPPGADLPTYFQGTGDCAGQASARAKSSRIGVQVFKGNSSNASPVDPCYEYAIGRRYGDTLGIPRGNPCGRPGAYPSIIAQAGAKWGALPVEDAPAYSGKRSNDWSCRGIPEKYLALGKDNAGGEAYPIRTVDEAIEALVNLYPLTIGVPFAPGRPYKVKGPGDSERWVIDFGDSGEGHAMAVTAYDGSVGDGYFFIQNSHGERPAQAVTLPLQGEPKGGFWVTRRQMEKWLDKRPANRPKTQCWAYSDVAGFPAEDEIDWTIFGDFEVPQPQMKEPNDENDSASIQYRSCALAV